MSNEASEIPAYNAMPCCTLSFVKLHNLVSIGDSFVMANTLADLSFDKLSNVLHHMLATPNLQETLKRKTNLLDVVVAHSFLSCVDKSASVAREYQ